MTRDEILAMEAGPELNALVEEHMMDTHIMTTKEMDRAIWGHSKSSPGNVKIVNGVLIHYGQRGQIKNRVQHFKRYSTDIAAAWEVVERMTKNDCSIKLEWAGPLGYKQWYCYVTQEVDSISRITYTGPPEIAPTAPLAICLAALLTVMEDEDD